MAQYEIKDVVCDYGIYEDGELILILDSAHNAHLVKRILEIEQSVPNIATPADFVEVVRCKDCKWYQESRILPPNKFCFRLKHPVEDRQIGYNFSPDDFCSYGERKENDL
ncbi:MAG: hypothetical protein J6Q10_03010 [Clostridia bacterium]|nr:hypothetical protein [Clostridia bacterium]